MYLLCLDTLSFALISSVRKFSNHLVQILNYSISSYLIFFFFWLCHLACRIFVSWPGSNLPPAVEAQSPNLWTTREVTSTWSLMMTLEEWSSPGALSLLYLFAPISWIEYSNNIFRCWEHFSVIITTNKEELVLNSIQI